MKAFIFALALLSSSLAHAGSVPSDATFDKVAKQAGKLGYTGYDVMVCLSSAGQVVAGGLWFWHSPLQIYLVNSDGTVTSTTRTSPREEHQTHKFVTADGNEVMLALGEVTGSENPGMGSVLKYENAVLHEGPMEMAQLVKCYSRQSGLESVN